MRIGQPRSTRRHPLALAALATAAALAAAPLASADTPLATVGSNGQSTLCTNDQQSSVNPDAAPTTGLVSLASGPCAAAPGQGTSGSSGSQGSTGSPTDQGGGDGTTAGTSSSTSTSRNTQKSTSTGSHTPTTAVSPPARKPAAATIAAASASGVKIAFVDYRLHRGKLLTITVAVRDRHHKFVRSAIVTLSRLPGAKATLAFPRSTFTNRRGKATFVLPITNRLSGQRLLMRITARTPTARVLAIGSRVILTPTRPSTR